LRNTCGHRRGADQFQLEDQVGQRCGITTTYFGKHNTGYTGVVILPSMAKLKGLVRESIDDEMADPVLFDVRDGGSENQVGYMGAQRDNELLKEKMEIAIYRGIAKEGIVFIDGMTGWTYYENACEHCHEASCVCGKKTKKR
jgi:hypothetical protein